MDYMWKGTLQQTSSEPSCSSRRSPWSGCRSSRCRFEGLTGRNPAARPTAVGSRDLVSAPLVPLAQLLGGGRNRILSSPAWISLVEQCKSSLEEASKIRSFVNSVGRIVDMSFIVVPNIELRASLRRCFVTFAMVFHDNEWLLTGKGIPRGIVKRLFYNVISGMKSEGSMDIVSSDNIIDMLF